jgi:putative transposase
VLLRNGARPDPAKVCRYFATAPNEKWVADITYSGPGTASSTSPSSSTVAAARSSAGSSRPTWSSQLVLDALEMANGLRRSEGGLIAHTDRGSQYTSLAYTDRLDELGYRTPRWIDTACTNSAQVN